jgi:poly(3-hydroxybutyrate) depolymerase
MESKRRCVRAVFLVATALASASAGFPGSSATATATVPALVDLVEYRCDAQVGLKLPLPVCNQSIAPLTQCELTGGEVVRLPGINNISRPFCRITPALGARKVPLVLFFHGAFGSADGVIKETNLVDFARNWSWPGGTSEGFVLAAPSGACLSWPRTGSNDGYHWDFYHRDLGSSSTNPDVALADAIIDAEVQRGTVDPSRIFVMGWSNGGFFGQMYAVARSAKRGAATPGGNFVAAASVYTAADPFNNLNVNTTPSCQLAPYPDARGARLMITSNDCDLIACDGQQAAELQSKNPSLGFTAPGFDVLQWVGNATALINAPVRWDLLNHRNQSALSSGCLHGWKCSPLLAVLAHSRWPQDRTENMLNFLANAPRRQRRAHAADVQRDLRAA